MSTRLTVDANIIGYWGFDEALETDVAIDATTNALNLTVTSSTGTAPGRVGNSRKFDGAASFASVTSSLLRLTGDLTLIVWPKLNSYNGAGTQRRALVSCGGPTTGDNVLYELFVSLSGELVYRHTSASGEVLVKTAGGIIKTGQIYSIALRRVANGGNQDIQFFIDNRSVAVASVTVNGAGSALPVPPPAANASAVFSVGRSQKESNSAFWDGYIDELSVHNTARLYQPYLIGAYFQAALRSATTKLSATNTVVAVSTYDMGAGVRWWCVERDRDLYVVRESPFGNFGAETRLTTVGGGNSSGVGKPELIYDFATDTLYVFFVAGNRIYKLTANSTDDPATINMPFTADTGSIIKSTDNADGGRLGDGGAGQREYLISDTTTVTHTPVKVFAQDPTVGNLGDGGAGQQYTFTPGTPNQPYITFNSIPGLGFGLVIGPVDSETKGYYVYRFDGGANTLLATPILLPNGVQYFVPITSRTYGAGYWAEAITNGGGHSGVYSPMLVDFFGEMKTTPDGRILKYGQNGDGQDYGNLGDGGAGQREYLLSDTTYINRTPVKFSTQDPDTNLLSDGGSGQAATATNGSTNRPTDAGKVIYL